MDHNKFFGRLLVPLPALISLHSLSSSPTSVLLPFFFVLPSPPLLFLSRTPSSLPFLSRPFSFSCLLFCNCRTSSGSAAAASAEERLGGERGRGGEGERGRGGEGEGMVIPACSCSSFNERTFSFASLSFVRHDCWLCFMFSLYPLAEQCSLFSTPRTPP